MKLQIKTSVALPVNILLILAISCMVPTIMGKQITVDNCEVCVKFLTRFVESLDSDMKSSPQKVEKELRKACKHTNKDDNRFCYYVGALEESATGMIGEITKPVSWSMPAEKICGKLEKQDSQICELKYDKTYDLATINLKKLKVKDLKKILGDWNEQCRGCTEKSDFIKTIEDLMPKYAPEAAAKRKEEL